MNERNFHAQLLHAAVQDVLVGLRCRRRSKGEAGGVLCSRIERRLGVKPYWPTKGKLACRLILPH